MNRRNFILQSGFAAMAVAGLPTAVRANRRKQQETPSTYRTGSDGSSGQVLYGLTIFNTGIVNFSNATDEQKTINMGVKQYSGTERTSPSASSEYTLTIKKVEKTTGTENTWDVTAKVEKLSGDFELRKDIAKTIRFRYKPYISATILGRKESVISELSYTTASSGGDCFLTTACVHHKGLADNCPELQTLRSLRDGFMSHSREGMDLISKYKMIGPSLVEAIEQCENRSEIYEYMYQHMILPSVLLVEQGSKEQAVAHYKIFVKALQEKYS